MTGEPIARSTVMSIRVDPGATRRIAEESQGRTLLIDFFASQCCTSVLVGDLETRWLDPGQTAGLETIGSIGATPIVAESALSAVLREGRARLVAGGLLGRSLQVRLDAPEAWLEFLDTPAARRPRGRGLQAVASSTPPTH
ncbi:MAG: hypothetical protein ABI573_09245 [Chloroflexota bacterium]